MKAVCLLVVLAMTTVPSLGCGGGGGDSATDPWPGDIGSILSSVLADPADDPEVAPGGGPPYVTHYAPADIRDVSLGMDGKYLYMRLDFSGILPHGNVYVPADGVVEEQTVHGQSFSINLDCDNSDVTGANGEGVKGLDIYFAINMLYGIETMAYANYDFPPPGDPNYGDVHYHNGHVEGEVGAGGPGYDFLLLRYDVSGVDPFFFPRGTTVEIGAWSEAESDLYHHFSFDPMNPSNWAIPD